MSQYIATFYSHFGAIRFSRALEKLGCHARLMPVPRNLSSSCGTCVSFSFDPGEEADTACRQLPDFSAHEELEQVVTVEPSGYQPFYLADREASGR